MSDAVTFKVQNHVGYLTLNQPKSMNSLTPRLLSELHRILDNELPTAKVRAIVLRGEGPSFCAGGNIDYFNNTAPNENVEHLIEEGILQVEGVITKLLDINVPLIACVEGSVAGAGISLMLTADIIVAAENTKFTMAYTKLGLTPDGGSTYLLPRVVGPRKAMELILTNELFLADRALSLGLINKVVPQDQAKDYAIALATQLSQGPTLAFQRTKKLIQASLNNDLATQYAIERDYFKQSFLTQDFMRGIQAFMNKQSANFEGD